MTPNEKWNADWVWLDYITPSIENIEFKSTKIIGIRDEEKNRWGLFRKSFELPKAFSSDSVKECLFKITADSRYKLFINGEFVGRGIYRCNKLNWYYDYYNVTKYLKAEKNIICVIVQYFGENCCWYEKYPDGGLRNGLIGKGFLSFELKIALNEMKNKKTETISVISDDSVRGHICKAWKQNLNRPWFGLPFIEDFNSNQFPHEWLNIDYDDSDDNGWDHLLKLVNNDLWPNLTKCDIPRMSEEKIQAKSIISAGTIEPFFDEEDIKDSYTEGEEPIDSFMELMMSDYKEVDHSIINQWNENKLINLNISEEIKGITFDMGREVTGFIFFEIETDCKDIVIDIGFSESLNDQKDILRSKYRPTFKFSSRYICQKAKEGMVYVRWQLLEIMNYMVF